MKRVLTNLTTIASGLMLSGVALAEGAEAAASSGNGLVAIASGLAIGLATFGAATSQGRAASAVLEGLSRNPNSRDQVFLPMILGFVFMEFQALLGFIIAFLWYTK